MGIVFMQAFCFDPILASQLQSPSGYVHSVVLLIIYYNLIILILLALYSDCIYLNYSQLQSIDLEIKSYLSVLALQSNVPIGCTVSLYMILTMISSQLSSTIFLLTKQEYLLHERHAFEEVSARRQMTTCLTGFYYFLQFLLIFDWFKFNTAE